MGVKEEEASGEKEADVKEAVEVGGDVTGHSTSTSPPAVEFEFRISVPARKVNPEAFI